MLARPLRRLLVIVVAPVVAAAACGSSGPGVAGAPTVLATTSIWAEIVREASCDLVPVGEIIPRGADSHTYEPSLADRGRLDDAALVVANGLGLESGLVDLLAAIDGEDAAVFTVSDAVDPATVSGAGFDDDHPDGAEERDDGHDHGGVDPHLWFDPVLVADVMPALGEQLVEHVGLERADVERCVADYLSELAALDSDIREILAPIAAERRVLVTNHDFLHRFADRYDLTVLDSVIPGGSNLAEASPGHLSDLADSMSAQGVDVLVVESETSDADADALAARLPGVTVVEIQTESLGPVGSTAATYPEALRDAAARLAEALAS